MKTVFPCAFTAGKASDDGRAGEGAYCQIAGKKAMRQRAVVFNRKGSVNRAGCPL